MSNFTLTTPQSGSTVNWAEITDTAVFKKPGTSETVNQVSISNQTVDIMITLKVTNTLFNVNYVGFFLMIDRVDGSSETIRLKPSKGTANYETIGDYALKNDQSMTFIFSNYTVDLDKGNISGFRIQTYIKDSNYGRVTNGIFNVTTSDDLQLTGVRSDSNPVITKFEIARGSTNDNEMILSAEFVIATSPTVPEIFNSVLQYSFDGVTWINLPFGLNSSNRSINGYAILKSNGEKLLVETTKRCYFRLYMQGDYCVSQTKSVTINPKFANVHMAGFESGGIAFGMYSGSNEGNPMFECDYPAFFYKGINGLQYGRMQIGTSAASIDDIRVAFQKPFADGSKPVVIATIESTIRQRLIPTVYNISNEGFTVGIYNEGSTNSNATFLNWIAITL